MQSSVSFKISRMVALRIRTIGTLHGRPFSEFENNRSHYYNHYNNNFLQEGNHHHNRRRRPRSPPRRIHSSLASTSFWRGLHQAARQGNGNLAEEIAQEVLQDYYRLAMAQQDAAAMTDNTTILYDEHNNNNNNTNRAFVESTNETNHPLDSQVFSLVLQAWKNSDCPSLHSALRAHNLLIQMAALADQDVLCDPPALEDYLAVLECWHHTVEASNNNNNNNKKNKNQIVLVLQHAEELWNQMRERQRREIMTNQIPRFEINEEAYECFVSLLAKAGRASQAEQVVEEALAGNPRYAFVAQPETTAGLEHDDPPKVGLSLCRAVLQAHLQSKETTAPQRSRAFLEKMRHDPCLPKPDVHSYNLVLERWLATSKASKNATTIAGEVEGLIHQMKEEDRIQPNLVSYQYCIDALARSGDAIRAETVLANLVKDYLLQYDADLKPTITPFQSVLWAYSKSRLDNAAERAESILNNMKELSTMLDTYPTVWSYNIVMKCWANSTKSPEAAVRTSALFEDLQRASFAKDETSENERINFEKDSQETSDVTPPTDLRPDATSMNTVLNVLSIHEGAVRTEQKLWEFYDAHVQDPQNYPSPDTIAFSTTINAWSNSSAPNAPDRADALLRKLIDLYETKKKRMHKPDIVTYTNVMQSWIKSKKPNAPEKAESILRELQRMEHEGDASMKPDAACWNSAISAWANAGNGERAEALFLEMVDGSVSFGGASPTLITLTNVLKAWTQTRSREAPHKAIALLARMEQLYKDGVLGVKPNVVNYSVVLDCLAYGRSPSAAERAEHLLQRMVDSNDPNLRPNVVSYNCVIKAWSYAKDPVSASKITALLRDLIDQSEQNPKMRPNENTFGTVLKFLAESDLPDKAKRAKAIENLMNIFLERGPRPWIKKELQRCLAANQVDSDVSRVETLPSRAKLGNQSNVTDMTTNSGSCRGNRANARFNSEAKVKNLNCKPLTGRPDHEAGDHGANVRDALVRVRLIGKVDLNESESNNCALNLAVVDGEDEYSCKVLNVDKNNLPDIKGGQFLNISYYWHRGEPVIVKMQDAIEGIEI